MKLMFPDQPVAMTGLPNAIASSKLSPIPLERCNDTSTSRLATD